MIGRRSVRAGGVEAAEPGSSGNGRSRVGHYICIATNSRNWFTRLFGPTPTLFVAVDDSSSLGFYELTRIFFYLYFLFNFNFNFVCSRKSKEIVGFVFSFLLLWVK